MNMMSHLHFIVAGRSTHYDSGFQAAIIGKAESDVNI